MIHATKQPEQPRKKTKKEDLPKNHRAVLSLIPAGQNKNITVKEIVALTGLKDQEVRSIVSELVTKHRYLIGASNMKGKQGYYLVTNEFERKLAIKNLAGRIGHMNKRIEALLSGELETPEIL